MNNPARNAMIICGNGTRPERNDPKTYQQNPPQPTASSRPRYSPFPIHHLRLFIAIFRLSHFPLFAVSPPSSPIISSPLVPTHSLPFHPPFPLCHHSPSPFNAPSRILSSPFPHPFISLPASSHSPSHILSFPFPHPFISLPASSHSPSHILSFPFPHPFISIPTPFHSPSRILSFPFPLRPPSSPKQRPTNTIITTKVKNGS